MTRAPRTACYIGSFRTKYVYRYRRPVTAIHNADTEWQPGHDRGPSWTPLQPTRRSPDYDPAHSVEGGGHGARVRHRRRALLGLPRDAAGTEQLRGGSPRVPPLQ